MKKTSFVIASYNSAELLKKTIPLNLLSGFTEIIIIDGMSTDETKELVNKFISKNNENIKLYSVPKKGLANARNIGTEKAACEYIIHAGPDNYIPKETLENMLSLTDKFDLVSCQTQLLDVNNYLEFSQNIYKKRLSVGEKEVVGTPYIAKSDLFKENKFDERMLNSDDTELCHRLKMAKHKIYRSEDICWETGFNGLSEIIERWMRWGRGDALFYKRMKDQWSFSRKVKSRLRPFLAEIVESYKYLALKEFIQILPFLVFICILRFSGWLRYDITER